jgi:CheY-like chemotaxis protein
MQAAPMVAWNQGVQQAHRFGPFSNIVNQAPNWKWVRWRRIRGVPPRIIGAKRVHSRALPSHCPSRLRSGRRPGDIASEESATNQGFQSFVSVTLSGDEMPGGALVLVLDDDQSMRTALERTLKVHGYVPSTFQSSGEFFSNASLNEAACVVLDIDLQERASGIEVARRLKRSGHTIPVIFISGSDPERTRADAEEAGCIAYLTKPFHPSALIEAIRKATRH